MRRLIVLAAAGALVLVPIAAEAKPTAKPTYKVSAAVNAVTSEVGKVVTVTGKITGKSAAGKFVTVQRKNGSSAWSNAARAKVTKKNTYVAKVKMTNGGQASVRVIMPATKAARSGVSSTRGIKVYRWLSMSTQSSVILGFMIPNTTGTIKGAKYPGSIAFIGGAIMVKPNKMCTRFTATLGFDDSSTLAPDSTFTAAFGNPAPVIPPRTVKTGDRINVAEDLTSVDYFVASLNNDVGNGYPLLASPRMYCAADALPTLTPSEYNMLAS